MPEGLKGKPLQVVWQPDALPGEPECYTGRQREFLTAREEWCGIDGGKGSGKTDLLIINALRPENVNNPRWLGVMFRREYKRLAEPIARAQYWLRQLSYYRATWRGAPNYEFVFPSGARLAFHNCERLGDEEQYQGWQITTLMFDQLEEFLEPQFNYLTMQNRPADATLKATVRWTANPWGVGRTWVKRRFVDNKPAGPHTLTVNVDGKTYVKTYRRVFATVMDNPALRNDQAYLATLAQESNEALRRAMMEGDWDAQPGGFFEQFDAGLSLIEPFEIPLEWRLVAGLDPGWAEPLSCSLMARDHAGNVYIISTYYQGQRSPEQHAPEVKGFIKNCPFTRGRVPETIASGHDAWSKKDRYAIRADDRTLNDIFNAHDIYLERATLDRHHGWAALKALLPGKLFIFKHLNNPVVEQMAGVMTDDKDPNDIQGHGNDAKVEDHALDCIRYGNMALYSVAAPPAPPTWEEEWAKSIGRGNGTNQGWMPGRG